MVSRLDGSIGSVRFACSRCGDIALPLVWLSYTVIINIEIDLTTSLLRLVF